ncbi:MAG TPA: hypothetical protein VF491_22290 [Vicinamibacterales bacterium]
MNEAGTLTSANLRGVLIPALLVFVGVVWWAGRNAADSPAQEPAPVDARPFAETQSAWPRLTSGSDRRAEPSASQAAIEVGAEASFGAYVDGKYRFLEPSEKLRAALLAREKVAVAINTARQSNDATAKESIPQQLAELAALDQKVGTLLRPGDLATYEVLKDSDVEQWQLDDYAGGVSNVAPLNDDDRRAILYTKLTHRQRFRQVLADSGLLGGGLNATERQYAFNEVSRALGESRDSYLREVRQYLYNDEQFTLLSNYENTEYADELEKLRGIASGDNRNTQQAAGGAE